MNPIFTDPVILICSGIILFGLLSLIWAVAKFRRLPSAAGRPASSNAPAPASDDLLGLDFSRTPVRAASPPSPPAAVTKEVAERLESMTQRLAEMQSVLTRQSAGSAAEPAGVVGQGFSPETIDKLLKIIGNVMQQVDILQKSVAPPKEAAASKIDVPGSPTTAL